MGEPKPSNPKKAVLLFSGGIDSTLVGLIMQEQGYEIHPLFVYYCQRMGLAEKRATRNLATLYQWSLTDAFVDCFQQEALLQNHAIFVPQGRTLEQMRQGVAPTYLPGRNAVLLSIAFAHAQCIGASVIFVGFNADDQAGYPDCRLEFLEAFNAILESLQAPIRVVAPLLLMSKVDIVREAVARGMNFDMTHSCYSPSLDDAACGRCDACILRQHAFSQLQASERRPTEDLQ